MCGFAMQLARAIKFATFANMVCKSLSCGPLLEKCSQEKKHYKEYMGLQCNLQGPQKKATFAKMAWGWNALGTILEMLGPEKMLVSNMLVFHGAVKVNNFCNFS